MAAEDTNSGFSFYKGKLVQGPVGGLKKKRNKNAAYADNQRQPEVEDSGRSIDRRLGVNPPDLSQQRGRPAPAFGANRDESKLSGVRLYERYGLVYNPEADANPVTQSERDALIDLYSELTGRDITTEDDTLSALERHNLILRRAGKRRAAERLAKGKDVPEFASAADALDWIRKQRPKNESDQQEPGVLDKALEETTKRLMGVPGVGPIATGIGVAFSDDTESVLKPVGDAVLKPVGEALSPIISQASESIAKAPATKLTRSGFKSSTVGENLRESQEFVADALDKSVELGAKIGDAPITLYGTGFAAAPGGQPGGIKRRAINTRPAPRDRLKGSQITVRDVVEGSQELAANPNSVVDVATKIDTNIPSADPVINEMSSAAQRGASVEEIQGMYDARVAALRDQGPEAQKAESPFSAEVDRIMRGVAKQNGWDDSDWDKLPVSEKVVRANTEYDYWKLMGRNFVRVIGETGASPAALKSIAEATASLVRGDPAEAEQMVSDAFAPFARFRETQQKRGTWAALTEFARNEPTYFLIILNKGLRVGSRVAGAGSRAAGYRVAEPGRVVTAKGDEVVIEPQPRPLPDLPEQRPGQAAQREWVAASAERERIAAEDAARQRAYDDATTIEEQRAAADIIRPSVPIGVTTGRLFNDAVMLPLKARFAERAKWYRKFIEKKDAQTYTRRELNVVQGVGLEITAILERAIAEREGKRIRVPVDRWTRDRVAFELSWSGELFDGKPLTPGVVADYFRGRADALREEMGGRVGRKAQRDQIAYWEAQEKLYRRLDQVEVDPVVMARVREEAKKLGSDNAKIVAAALGKPLSEVKRADYIRLVVIDPQFEIQAQLRRRAANMEPIQLREAQRRIASLSEQILRYAQEDGWGKAGPSRSVARYTQVREELIAEMQTARRLAQSLGDDDLVRVLDDALAKMRLARSAAAARAVGLQQTFDALDELNLSNEQVAALSPDARAAYEEASAAGAEATRLADERQAALGELGQKRVTAATVAAAERRVREARDVLESRRQMPKPDAKSVAAAEAKLAEAEARLERVRGAQESVEQLRIAELSRDQKVREARRILNKGRTVLDEGDVSAAIDVAGQLAAVRIRGKKDFDFYTIARARGEVLDEFIARVEAQGKNPVLHLVQTRAFEELGDVPMVSGGRRLRTDTMARTRSGRLVSSEGYTFAMGYEDPNLWRNLMFDTQELQSSAVYGERMTQLLELTSPRIRFRPEVLEEALQIQRQLEAEDAELIARGGTPSEWSPQTRALREVINARSVEINLQDFVPIPPLAPGARRPSMRVDVGAVREMDSESLGELTVRQITDRDIDPDAPGDYFLVPSAVYKGIMRAVEDEAFRFKPPSRGGWRAPYWADKVTRAWRTVTLNVFPRTAAVNTLGSGLLAIQAGAGPRAIQYAAMALYGIEMRMPDGTTRKLPVPPELRQRYYEQQLTDPWTASRMKLDDLPEPDAKDAAYAWMAWYMNSIRHVNGMSEDLGRLAVWYSRAYPEAMRNTPDAPRFFLSAKKLNDDAIDLLEAMARGEGEWKLKHEAWMQQSFDFLGDLHRGGRFASSMRIAIPFWQWYAHMLKLTFFTMPLKYPGRAIFLQMLGDIGAAYQERHGVLVPWSWGFVPFSSYEEAAGAMGESQVVTEGFDFGQIVPQYTLGQYFLRDGEPNLGKAIQDSTNPLMTNTSLIIWSAIVGQAKELDGSNVTRAAKDEFGVEINSRGRDSQFWNYVANRVFRMVPLSPSLMSSMGRASTAFPFPGQMAEKYRPEGSITRAGELNARADATDLGFNVDSWAKFLAKITTGVRFDEVEGLGPIWRKQMEDLANRLARQKSQDEKKIAEAMRQAREG